MLSVNSNPTVTTTIAQPQNTVAFRGKAPNLKHLSKKMLDSRDVVMKNNQAIPADKLINSFANIKHSLKTFFTKLFG